MRFVFAIYEAMISMDGKMKDGKESKDGMQTVELRSAVLALFAAL